MRNDNSNSDKRGESMNPYSGILIIGSTARGKLATINQQLSKLKKCRDRTDDPAKS